MTLASRQADAPGGDWPLLRVERRWERVERLPIADRTRAQIFAAVLVHGPISRTQLSELTGLSASTISKAVTPMVADDYLLEAVEASSGPGRPQTMLRVSRQRHSVVGIKLAPDHVVGVLTDMTADVTACIRQPVGDSSPDTVLDTAAEVVEQLFATSPTVRTDALGIGVGVSGHVDSWHGVCRRSALLDWRDVDVSGPLSRATGLPVVVNNDVNTLVVAEEWFGAGRGTRSFAVVTVGAGVGCGLLIDGELFAGSTGLAGELGHIPLDRDGPLCSCGNRGCLEAVAGDAAVLRAIRQAGGPAFDTVAAAADAARSASDRGRAAARAAFESAGEAVGRGIAVLLNVLNLEKVVLSGEGVIASDLFGEALRVAVDRHAFSTSAGDCELLIQALDEQEWARGAACLVIKEAVGASPTVR